MIFNVACNKQLLLGPQDEGNVKTVKWLDRDRKDEISTFLINVNSDYEDDSPASSCKVHRDQSESVSTSNSKINSAT